MDSKAKTLLKEALELSEEDRASILEALGESLETDGYRPLSPKWVREVNRRIKVLEEGQSEVVSAGAVYLKLGSNV